jgi:hypothetical protein
MPNLEKVGVLERRLVKDENGDDDYCCFMEEIDVLSIRNTERIQNILNNPNNYSLDDLLKINKSNLHGVSQELREKLFELATEKSAEELRRKFRDEGYHSQDNENEENNPSQQEKPNKEKDSPSIPSEEPSELPTPQDTHTPQESPSTPKENDDKQTILALQQKITELETKIRELESDKNNSQKREEIRNEILNSELSEEQKQELLKLLDEQNKTGSEKQPSNSTNY